MEQPARQAEQPDTVRTPVSERSLRRSADNRIVGGVCGGLAEHTDIDPIIYRVLAVVLTLVGGAGLILYGAAMLLVPDARTGTAPLGKLLSGGTARGMRTAGLLLVIVCLLVVTGGLTGVFGGGSLSIVVIAGLAALAAHRRGVSFRHLLRGVPDASGDRGAGRDEAPRPPRAARDDTPAAQQPPEGAQRPYVDLAALGGGDPIEPGSPQEPLRRRRPPSITAVVWLLAAAVGGLVGWLQHQHAIAGDVRVPLAAALGTLGLGLVVSAWLGRAAVKAWGVLLTLALGAVTVAVGPGTSVHWTPVTWAPTSVAELREEQPYRVGIASATLDLTEVPVKKKRTYPASVTMQAGQLVVKVPPKAYVDFNLTCDQCSVTAFGYEFGGTDVSEQQGFPPQKKGKGYETLVPERARERTSAPVIELDMSVGAGRVKVRRAA